MQEPFIKLHGLLNSGETNSHEFESIHEICFKILVVIAKKRSPSLRHEDAEDLVEDTLISFWKWLARNQLSKIAPGKLLPFLSAILRNKTTTFFRRSRTFESCVEKAAYLANELNQANSEAVQVFPDWCSDEELQEALEQSLDDLQPEERRILYESYFNERLQIAIAAEMGMPQGTLAQKVRRMRLFLKGSIEKILGRRRERCLHV